MVVLFACPKKNSPGRYAMRPREGALFNGCTTVASEPELYSTFPDTGMFTFITINKYEVHSIPFRMSIGRLALGKICVKKIVGLA
jgi:hypothetical protein